MLKRLIGLFGIFTKRELRSSLLIMNKLYKLVIALTSLITHTSLTQTITETFGSGANQFSIDFVTIGNPDNSADTTGSPNPAGSVAYAYNIGKYEVSRDMITKANILGSLGVTLDTMSRPPFMEIPGGTGANRPAAGISWNEAARFVNWLNTSKGYQADYRFTTFGVNDNITLWGIGEFSGSNQYRHKDAYFFLPSLDEWYKAAYGSSNGIWFKYPNGSDNAPEAVGQGTSGAVYQAGGPADINAAGGLSAWGTMAQGGNVWEWVESASDGTNDNTAETREMRGGSFGDIFVQTLESSSRNGNFLPSYETFNIGFRVASVPEPSALSLLAVGLGGLAMLRHRRS